MRHFGMRGTLLIAAASLLVQGCATPPTRLPAVPFMQAARDELRSQFAYPAAIRVRDEAAALGVTRGAGST